MKIPKELYVTAKEYTEGYYSSDPHEFLFGFLHPHEPNSKTDAKRKQTQLDWAYGNYLSGMSHEIDENGTVRSFRTVWTWASEESKGYSTQVERPVEFQPTVWKNEPLTGYQILKSVSRSSTSNKLWRVLDPRGVVFEITTGCLETLIANTNISHGLIDGECVWSSSKNLVLCSTI